MVFSLLIIAMATMLSVYSSVEGSRENTEQMIDDYQSTLEEYVESSEKDLLGITVTSAKRIGLNISDSSLTMDSAAEIEELDEVSEVIPVVSRSYGEFESMFPGGSGFRPPDGFDPSQITDSDGQSLSDRMEDMQGRMESLIDYTITGLPLYEENIDSANILPDIIVEGRELYDIDTGCALISEELTDFFDAGVGDVIEVGEGSTLEVVGVYSSSLQNRNVYTSISNAREIAGMGENEVSELWVTAVNESVVEGLVAVLQEYYSGYYRVSSNLETSARQVEQMTKNIESQIDSLETDLEEVESQGTIIVAISAGTAGLIVLFIMLYTVKERTKEIGTMKAIGFTNRSIMVQIVLEGFLLALLSGVIGILLGLIGSPMINDLLMPESASGSSGEITFLMIGAGLIIMILLGAVGSLYPAWVASRKSPVEAMRHE
jgi:ABC-type antimicrobial peptide transport system permease subunit